MPEKKRHGNRKWKRKEIEHLRGEWSILSESERGINAKRKMCGKLKKKHKLNIENITRIKETVKQRIQFKAQRMQKVF